MPDFRINIEPGPPKLGAPIILVMAVVLGGIGFWAGEAMPKVLGEILVIGGVIVGLWLGFKIWASEQ